MNDFLNIRAVAGVIVLELYGEIHEFNMLSDWLRWQISEYGEEAPVVVRISSPGGDPRAAMSLYQILKDHKGPTEARIEYMCDSAATLPACACDRVIGNSFPFEYMVHDPKLNPDWFRVEEGEAMVKFLSKIRDDMVNIYVEKTGQSEDKIREWMQETKFMNAEEALALGFIDEVKELEQTLEAKVDYKVAANAHADQRPEEFQIEGRGMSPATSNNKNNTTMSTNQENWLRAKLQSLFGKGDEADDQDLFLESKELKAKAETIADLESTIEEKEKTINKLRSQVEALESEIPSKEEQEEEIQKEVEALVEAAVKDFKVAASAKDDLTERYKGKPEELKATLELIPENALKQNGGPNKPKSKASAGSITGVNDQAAKELGLS